MGVLAVTGNIKTMPLILKYQSVDIQHSLHGFRVFDVIICIQVRGKPECLLMQTK